MSGSSFSRKLARLSLGGAPAEAAPRVASSGDTPGAATDAAHEPGIEGAVSERRPTARRSGRPSLDELRDRIAGVIARGQAGVVGGQRPLARRDDEGAREAARVARGASTSTLPFLEEETADGPLFLARKRTPIASRFGDAPLHTATLADPTMLALLARDPNLARCDPRRALYLDTETTGLMGGTGTVPFLIGLAYYDEAHESFVVEQMLLRRFGEERPMLSHLAERLAQASCVVTFNGKSFDMPLVRSRAVMNQRSELPELPQLDLLHVARRVHGGWLSSCTLRSVEERVLGHVRYDDVCGSDICAAYFHFVRTGDEYALGGVVEHNLTDVLAMVALVGFYGEPLHELGGSCDAGAESTTGGLAKRAEDLAGVARTLSRAGALERAETIADLAVQRGGGRRAHHVRGDIVKARGDKERAILEYERALSESDDAPPGDDLPRSDISRSEARVASLEGPPSRRSAEVEDGKLHLALAKLYEHAQRSFDKALDIVGRGTGEAAPAHEKRRARLVRKLETSATDRAAEQAKVAPPSALGTTPRRTSSRRGSRGAS